MIGLNKLVFNQAQMKEAIEFYLKQQLFKDGLFQVISVNTAKGYNDDTFEIVLGEKPNEDIGSTAH